MMRDVGVLPFFFLFSAFIMILRHHSVSATVFTALTRNYNLSHSRECDDLLQLSNSFIIAEDTSGYYCDELHSINSYPTTSFWKKGTSCGSWDGVTCHMSTNHLIGLDLSCSWLGGAIHTNSTLFLLWDLRWLSLTGNNFYGSQISPRIYDTFPHWWLNDTLKAPNLTRSTTLLMGILDCVGIPSQKACGTDGQQSRPSTSPGEREEEAESGHWIEWGAVPVGYGCGLALGISASFIMWETLRPKWLVRMI
ncbi:hypothetical protein CRG98_002114 [Punica granatum]|uniref:Leucine-rich repeat-containing N-terminal plant-type domain-containing protein n=1 Tax=Punica granatum TaxID=22663 RepID=A0A2I0L9Y8_PUNGR|nr:hypothetical protein CRG98_002114 [Punica granatum]